ncbi:MAG: hypothetical protein CL678_10085 [Bdellovibrionaceae bacterium]|nr:hypothetical protein [Pseudobdellovibrionaceae bacterium]
MKLFVFLMVIMTQSSFANVSIKNGNFFVGFRYMAYSGGMNPKIQTSYNSKTDYKGYFGPGWGSLYEVSLEPMADGSIVVNEYGGGAENIFTPVNFDKKELDRAIKMITKAAKKYGSIGSSIEKYQNKLRTNATFRNDEWSKFVKKGYLKPRKLKPNTRLISNKFSYQFITKIRKGYVRKYDSGKIEIFNNAGKLIEVRDKNQNYVKFKYDKKGNLRLIKDNLNRKMKFTFDNKGHIVRIDGEDKQYATFAYNSKGELVKSRDSEGGVFGFEYSKDGRFNLTKIIYTDGSYEEIKYHPKSLYEHVKSVKDRDGVLTSYQYEFDKKQRGHFKVDVDIKNKKGRRLTQSSYEYFLKYKKNGEEWTYRIKSSVDGIVTDTVYNECCGLPLKIRKGNNETTFAYDKKGHVTRKEDEREVTKLTYHPSFGKVASVTKYSKLNKGKVTWSKFKYDKKGNLVFAKNSEKKGVSLFYDKQGRIASMFDQKKRRIDFQYNSDSKPIKISDSKLGSMRVSYNKSGQIEKVDSSGGRKVAVQVTDAFQNLLAIIRPAGVGLTR